MLKKEKKKKKKKNFLLNLIFNIKLNFLSSLFLWFKKGFFFFFVFVHILLYMLFILNSIPQLILIYLIY